MDICAAAREHEANGHLGEALAEYDRLIGAGLGGSTALMRRGLLYNQLGSFARMTAEMDDAAQEGFDDRCPAMRQGHIARAMGRQVAPDIWNVAAPGLVTRATGLTLA